MAPNTFGNQFRISTFGESHGPALGGVIDGCPAGLIVDLSQIERELERRRPGQSKITTQRKEPDTVEFLSGIFEGKTTGTPIGFIIKNTNQKSQDYGHIKDTYRPSHADWVYDQKYGFRDYKGGGRSSARETVSRVVAGAIAKQLVAPMTIRAYVQQVGSIRLDTPYQELDLALSESNIVRCPDTEVADQMIALIAAIKKQGDTVGGVIRCIISNVPVGLGEPVFQKLHAQLGAAMLSINAVKGFAYGSGFSSASMLGSEHNDYYTADGSTKTNFSGGIQGGISNGMDIYFDVAFKPVATLLQPYETLTNTGELVDTHGKGRHDPCVVPRAVPIVEAMAALVMADFLLINRLAKLK
ncbi:MAG: chorismate synthase [Bacteroidetes bacterium]|jgi:chorismate synthase|nr:chorismate synthase [Bacteroidota bacterium]